MSFETSTGTDFEFENAQLQMLATQRAWALDHQLNVQFYKHAELNNFKSREAGRKIFDEKIYIRILIPANRLNVIECEVTDEHKRRFAKQYAAFMQRGEQLLSGTPLDQLRGLSQSHILELRALKIETVEQLAGMPDTTVQLLGTGGQTLKQRARTFLDERSSNIELAATSRAQADRIRELEELVAQMAQHKSGDQTSVVVTDNQK
jgi:hypothetical protein